MTAPLVVSIPHRLGQAEATRRLKSGIGRASASFSHVLSVDEEVWNDNRLSFRMRALGQAATGTIEVMESEIRLEVVLPWLLAKIAERVVPTIRKQATLLLDKK